MRDLGMVSSNVMWCVSVVYVLCVFVCAMCGCVYVLRMDEIEAARQTEYGKMNAGMSVCGVLCV